MKHHHTLPSHTDLIYFIEVANILNISRAAESLGITQPSLTLAIRRLESALGETILNRHKRGVTLTRAGTQLLSHARNLLEQWENIKSKTRASVYEIQGSFTIGCHISVALHTLPKFLPKLIEDNSNLEIKLHHELSRKITEKIINHKIDIGIVANPLKHPDLVIQHLYDDKVSLWSNGKKRNSTVLICDPELIQTRSILKKTQKAGGFYERLITTNSLEEIAVLTQAGCGVGILPSRVANHFKLTMLDNKHYYEDEICLVYRGENRHIKSIQVITQAIKKTVGQQSQ